MKKKGDFYTLIMVLIVVVIMIEGCSIRNFMPLTNKNESMKEPEWNISFKYGFNKHKITIISSCNDTIIDNIIISSSKDGMGDTYLSFGAYESGDDCLCVIQHGIQKDSMNIKKNYCSENNLDLEIIFNDTLVVPLKDSLSEGKYYGVFRDHINNNIFFIKNSEPFLPDY